MQWHSIPGFSFYEASEAGDIRRSPTKRMKGWGPKRPPGGLLHPCYHDKRDCYLAVHMKDDAGVKRVMKVHQLIAATFHGPKPSEDHCALHRDDNKKNNRKGNIYWGTKRRNAIDRSINGRGVGRLTFEDVLWIRELYFGDKWGYHDLAALFGLSASSIAQVVKGRSYAWVGNALQN